MKFKLNSKLIAVAISASVVVSSLGGMQLNAAAAGETQLSTVSEDTSVSSLVLRYDQVVGQIITNQKQQEELAAQAAAAAKAAAEKQAAEAAAKAAAAKQKASSKKTRSYSSGKRSYSPAGTIGQTVVNAAKSCIGIPYGGSYAGMTFDCSGLVCYAYGQVGIHLSHAANQQAQWCSQKGYQISMGELQPGDLVFWRYSWGRGFMNIGHVGIYAGSGQVIDASPNGVVMRSLFDRGSIVFCARPY